MGSCDLGTDYIIAAISYRFVTRLAPFGSQPLLRDLRHVEQAPLMSSRFESSIPSRYFIGLANACNIRPVVRSSRGSRYAAERIYHTIGRRRAGRSVRIWPTGLRAQPERLIRHRA